MAQGPRSNSSCPVSCSASSTARSRTRSSVRGWSHRRPSSSSSSSAPRRETHDDPDGEPTIRSPDHGDDYLIALAEITQAVIVSGDGHLLGLAGQIPVFSPAVHHQHLARDEARVVGREEQRGAGQVVGVRSRPGSASCAASLLEQPPRHRLARSRGVDHAGRDAVDRDAPWCPSWARHELGETRPRPTWSASS